MILKPYFNKEIPQYCFGCGRKLIIKEYFSSYYNENTGEKLIYTLVTCPKKIRICSHYRERFNENGDEIVDYNY